MNFINHIIFYFCIFHFNIFSLFLCLQFSFFFLKVMLHGTIRKDDF